MSNYVGRLAWDAIEVASGQTEAGVATIALDDVAILRYETLRSQQMLIERMREFGKSESREAKMKEAMEEIQRDPSANEVVEVWYSKLVPLSPNYHFGMAEHPEKKLTGFGFSGNIGSIQREPTKCRTTFSWDWFHVTGMNTAQKLQEEGRLHFEQTGTAVGTEITYMRFETDVSLRIAYANRVDPQNPAWRINIRKGSEIVWPTYRPEGNLDNGFLS